MKCSDCLYSPVCGGYMPSDTDTDDVLELCAKGLQDQIPNIEDICLDFKDNSKYVEVTTAKWEIYEPTNELNKDKKFITCTNCKSVIDCTNTNVDENEYDWCPYCGAKIIRGGDK